jgi:hypothetical protein
VRRLIILVTVVLLMTAMLMATAIPALAALRPPVAKDGTSLPATVCESELAPSPPVGWRNGQCWVFYDTATSLS